MPESGEATPAASESGEAPADAAPPAGEPAPAAGEAPAAAEATALTAAPMADGVVTLSPENTKIQFTGTHSPPKQPDPRVGGFAKFTGEAKVDAEAKKLESVTVDIDTTSLFTPIPKLTNHLQTEDFFDVRKYPAAKFESTEITAGESGQTTIKGNLTLHGQTKEISFPATVKVSDKGLTLKSDFDISRAEFGIGKPEGIEDNVALSIAIGEKTAAP
jgi:polyisoprenoid-binding protein YceI